MTVETKRRQGLFGREKSHFDERASWFVRSHTYQYMDTTYENWTWLTSQGVLIFSGSNRKDGRVYDLHAVERQCWLTLNLSGPPPGSLHTHMSTALIRTGRIVTFTRVPPSASTGLRSIPPYFWHRWSANV